VGFIFAIRSICARSNTNTLIVKALSFFKPWHREVNPSIYGMLQFLRSSLIFNRFALWSKIDDQGLEDLDAWIFDWVRDTISRFNCRCDSGGLEKITQKESCSVNCELPTTKRPGAMLHM